MLPLSGVLGVIIVFLVVISLYLEERENKRTRSRGDGLISEDFMSAIRSKILNDIKDSLEAVRRAKANSANLSFEERSDLYHYMMVLEGAESLDRKDGNIFYELGVSREEMEELLAWLGMFLYNKEKKESSLC